MMKIIDYIADDLAVDRPTLFWVAAVSLGMVVTAVIVLLLNLV